MDKIWGVGRYSALERLKVLLAHNYIDSNTALLTWLLEVSWGMHTTEPPQPVNTLRLGCWLQIRVTDAGEHFCLLSACMSQSCCLDYTSLSNSQKALMLPWVPRHHEALKMLQLFSITYFSAFLLGEHCGWVWGLSIYPTSWLMGVTVPMAAFLFPALHQALSLSQEISVSKYLGVIKGRVWDRRKALVSFHSFSRSNHEVSNIAFSSLLYSETWMETAFLSLDIIPIMRFLSQT